jgi:hypothetical protein
LAAIEPARGFSARRDDVVGRERGELVVGGLLDDDSRSAWRPTAASNTLRTKRALPKPRVRGSASITPAAGRRRRRRAVAVGSLIDSKIATSSSVV